LFLIYYSTQKTKKKSNYRYKFRPVSSNPYLQVEIEEDITEEVQMESLSTSHKRKPTNHNPEE